jgi:ASPIC and UnbV/FG-GAP-like repeat
VIAVKLSEGVRDNHRKHGGGTARRSLLFTLFAFVAAAAPAAAAQMAEPPNPATPQAAALAAPASAAAPVIRFQEIAERAGVRFVQTPRRFHGRHKAQVLEMFTDGGAAVAVGDYDGDGDDDLFITDSDEGKTHRLMRNDGVRDGVPVFTDVTAAAGVGGGNDSRSIVADALWFDYDNDGRLDLYLGRFGTPLLFRNLGKDAAGHWRFEDVSQSAGLTLFGNTIGTIAFDADADGFLDLMLANYFQPLNLLDLKTTKVLPNNLDYATNGGGVTFYRSVKLPNGSRGFVDQTKEAGLSHHTGWSLDIGHADLDNDGDQDVYVAGDYGTDRLFLNQGVDASGRVSFRDATEKAMGLDTRKGMNVDMGDYDRDGWLDIYVTNITDEYMKECNFLWRNNGVGKDGALTFSDFSKETGTCDSDWGWAAKFADFDNDGWEDIFAVNGLRSGEKANYIPLLLENTIIKPGVDFADLNSYPDIGDMTWSGYQKKRLFHNLGDGTFKEIGGPAGVANDRDGRGVGVGDFNNDGRLDFYQGNARQASQLYLNASENVGHWAQLRLVGVKVNRDAIGARVYVKAGGESWFREVNGGNAYSSQSTFRLHFGIGANDRIDEVEIRWPGGTTEILKARDGKPPIPIDAITTIVEGKGVQR